MTYSKMTGLKKTAKNVLVTWGVPAFIYVLNNVSDFVPDKYLVYVLPVVGGMSYFMKNWYEFNNKKI